MLIDCKENGSKEVFIGINENEISSKSIIEKTGFKVYRKFQRTKSFGIVNKKIYS
jgi:predicted acetyltransferase